MKIALYSPYLKRHVGGGERYMLTVAECLQQRHDVTIFFDELTSDLRQLKKKHEEIFHLDLGGTVYRHGPFGRSGSLFRRYLLTRQFDVFYYLTDGSFFLSGAKHNLVHFQIPLTVPPAGSNRLKFLPWKTRVANASFTKKIIEEHWNIRVQYIHYGRCDTESFRPGKKENIILSVGRFFVGAHNKKHEVLLHAFKKLKLRDWTFVLIGNVDPGEENARYVEKLQHLAKGYEVSIVTNAPFTRLQKEYSRAKLYWHAAGFGEDEDVHPERVEHMGLSVVEAMAAGCVPLVVRKGGLPELVTDGRDGYLWNSIDELGIQTRRLIGHYQLWRRMSTHARGKSKQFDRRHFCQKIERIIAEQTR